MNFEATLGSELQRDDDRTTPVRYIYGNSSLVIGVVWGSIPQHAILKVRGSSPRDFSYHGSMLRIRRRYVDTKRTDEKNYARVTYEFE